MNVQIAREQTLKTAPVRIELPGLLAMRCYAAIAIMLFHLIALANLKIPGFLSFIPTHFGLGVPLFYIVSAFGLFVGYAGRIGSREEMREFYLRRFSRIAPLFYFMMIFYYPLYWALGGSLFPLSQFVNSGLFIFNFLPQDVTGYVMASWSIGVEMAFYAILPLLVFAITGLGRSLIFLVVTVFMAANWALAFQGVPPTLVPFSQYSLMAYLFYFAAGISGYFVWLRLRRLPPPIGRMILLTSLLTMAALIHFAGPFSEFIWRFLGPNGTSGVKAVWAVTLASAVVGVSLHPQRWFVNPVAKLLGNASFSIYLWHPIVIVVLDRLGTYRLLYAYLTGTATPFLASIIATLAALVPLSLMSYQYIERPGMALGARFIRLRPQNLLAISANEPLVDPLHNAS